VESQSARKHLEKTLIKWRI